MRLSVRLFLGHLAIVLALLVTAGVMQVPPPALIALALVGTLASLLGSTIILQLLNRPVRELTLGAQQVAAGDFKPITVSQIPGDFHHLASSFNQMVESLQSRDQQLQALNDELSRRLRELNALYEVSRSVNSSLDVQEVLRTILNETVKTFPTATKSLIHLIDEGEEQLVPTAVSGSAHQLDKLNSLSLKEGIAAQVARERRVITVTDTAKDPNFVDLGSEVRSLMVAPLEIGEMVIGTLSLDSTQRDAFTTDMEDVFRSLANRAAIALENARLYEDSQQRVEQLTSLYRAALTLSGEQSPESLHQQVVQSAVSLLHANSGLLYLADLEQESLSPTQAINVPDELLTKGYHFGEGLVGQVAATHTPHLVASEEIGHLNGERATTEAERGNVLAVPIIWENKVLGVLEVWGDPALVTFEATHLRLLTLFAQQAASTIENARLLANQRRRSRQLALLNNLNRRFASILDVNALLEEAVRGVEETFGYPAVSIGLIEGEWVTMMHSSDPKVLERPDRSLRVGEEGIIGRVAASGQPHLANDVSQDPYYLKVVASVQSELAVPIIGKEGVLGVLDVQERQRNAFLYNDVTLLQSLAVQLGIALDNARLFRAAQRRAEQLTKILEVTEEVRKQQELGLMLQKIAEVVQQTLGWHTVSLFLHDTDGMMAPVAVATNDVGSRDRLLTTLPHQLDDELWQADHYRISHSFFVPAESTEESETLLEGVAQGTPPGSRGEGNKPWEWQDDDLLVIPIVGPSGTLGYLRVDAPADQRRPTLEGIQMLEIFAHQAASAIEDARRLEELHAKTAALQVANQDLSRASKLKSEFLANMSHELRTPLNAILGFSEILIDQAFGELNDRQLKYLTNINTSGQHLLDLINDILDLSKIEAGRMELMLELFRLSGAIHEIYAVIESLASKKELKVTLDMERAPERIFADRLRFKQVLYNIIANAVKFTPEGGAVYIRAWQSETETLDNGDQAWMVFVEVEDTGIGIPEDQLEQIFDVFHRLDRSYRSETEGTGLGLALVRRFVELHGGDVTARSTVGEGSVFTISLPQTDTMMQQSMLETFGE